MNGLDISTTTMIAALLMIGVTTFIILVIALTKTKRATAETQVGQYEFLLLPSGDRLSGLVTLAQGMVSSQYSYDLAAMKQIKPAEATKLKEMFDNLFFYALKSGNSKYLIASSANIESPQYSKVYPDVFVFPFGYVSRRMVIADAVEGAKWAGFKVVTISPMNLETNIKPDTFEKMENIGAIAACIKELSIRAKTEVPWKQIANSRAKQLKEAQDRIAEIEHEMEVMRLAITKERLVTGEGPTEPPKPKVTVTAGFSIWRVIVSFIAFCVTFYFTPMVYPLVDPWLPSIIMFIVMLLVIYPVARKLLSRWF